MIVEKYKKLWEEFVKENPEYKKRDFPEVFYFCDNEKDANELVDLVEKGKKKEHHLYIGFILMKEKNYQK